MNIVYIEDLDLAVNLTNLDAMEEDKIKGVHYTNLYMAHRQEPIKVQSPLNHILSVIQGSQNQDAKEEGS